MKYRSWKNQNVSIYSDSAYGSVAYDPVKTKLSESEAEVEEQTNHSASSQALRVLRLWLTTVFTRQERALRFGCLTSISLALAKLSRATLKETKTSLSPLFES